jgi:hypothetical protein
MLGIGNFITIAGLLTTKFDWRLFRDLAHCVTVMKTDEKPLEMPDKRH